MRSGRCRAAQPRSGVSRLRSEPSKPRSSAGEGNFPGNRRRRVIRREDQTTATPSCRRDVTP
eukprot:6190407-Pleurochrysis_carterae.AAC.3